MVPLAPNGMRIRFWLDLPSGEMVNFGFVTALRDDPDDLDTITGLCDQFLDDLHADTITGGITSARVFFDQWKNPLLNPNGWGFFHWDTLAFTQPGAPSAPPQLAIAISLNNPSNTVPRRQQYNRFFLGPVRSGINDAAGELGATQRGHILDAVGDLVTGLEQVPEQAPNLVYGGLFLANYKDEVLHEVQRVRVGSLFDTQRRRRNGLAEVYSDLPVGP